MGWSWIDYLIQITSLSLGFGVGWLVGISYKKSEPSTDPD